jgi:hypothetical protein
MLPGQELELQLKLDRALLRAQLLYRDELAASEVGYSVTDLAELVAAISTSAARVLAEVEEPDEGASPSSPQTVLR